MVDLAIRLNLDYYDKVREITVQDQPKVAQNYLRTTFFFDLITTIPFVRIVQNIVEFDKNHEIKLLFLIKMLRINKGNELLSVTVFQQYVQ